MALSEFPRMGLDPFLELRRMQSEMNRLFSGFNAVAAREFPPINIWLGENSVVVTAELPGVSREDVNINLQDEVLTLEGARQPQLRQQDVKWHRRERAYGSFARTVQLPFRAQFGYEEYAFQAIIFRAGTDSVVRIRNHFKSRANCFPGCL
jgi:HSP20 family protein